MNPTFTNVSDLDKLAQGSAGVEWTHWGDTVNIYGTGDDGFARVPWDNVGVQYGLEALKAGIISPTEFLDLNAGIGSWKDTADMVRRLPVRRVTHAPELRPVELSQREPQPRRRRNALAQPGKRRRHERGLHSGMEFQGDIDIPVIDWRHYLEDELDMHHSQESFVARQRMLNATATPATR